jgi:hypothetical protein
LKAVEAVLFGYGVIWACRAVAAAVQRAARRFATELRWMPRWLCGLTLAAVMAIVYREYAGRPEFVAARQEPVRAGSPSVAAYAWIRQHTRPENVFLTACDQLDIRVVYPAARKLVAVSRVFSNPYVDWAPRAYDAWTMLQSLRTGDTASFTTLASKYGVSYVLVSCAGGKTGFSPAASEVLRQCFESGDIRIFEVTRRNG